MDMLSFLSYLQPAYLYPILFFGHIFLGGLVLIPAIYLSVTETLSLPALFVIIVASSMLNDSFWYAVGRYIKKERVYSLKFIRRRMEEAKKFSAFYDRYGLRAVFFTKFIYGTRIASHILAGVHKLSFFWFLSATAAGSAVWFVVMYFLVAWLNRGISGTGSVAFQIQMTFFLSFSIG